MSFLPSKINIVAVSFDNFKSVHPIIDKAEKDLNSLHQPELTSSSESEDGMTTFLFSLFKINLPQLNYRNKIRVSLKKKLYLSVGIFQLL